MTLKEITLDYIINYCTEHNETAWLKEVAITPCKPDKNGKLRKISFIEIRNLFVIKFMPEIMPEHKPKKPSMYERIAAL